LRGEEEEEEEEEEDPPDSRGARQREIRGEALDRMLRDRIARIEAELRAKDPNYRGLDSWIEQVRAEAENAA
jgi:hypothetical protein